jgi:site-specific DNA recombinase
MKLPNLNDVSDIVYIEEPVKYVLYSRKSSESDELQAMSIESQVNEMLQLATRENLNVIEIKREAHSAKSSGERSVFREILDGIRSGKYTGILTWAPDRLSRNAGDLGSLVDLMDQKRLVHIQTYTQKFTNDPSQKFLLMILCSQAKLENDNKGLNVKRGLKARVELGLWPCVPPTGYLVSNLVNEKAKCIQDEERAPIIKQCFEKIAYENMSGRQVYLWLSRVIKFKTKTGKLFSIGNFYRMLETTFYYGEFEYPKGSGNRYKGIHKPIITKEVFDLVQTKIASHVLKSDIHKEFAFTRLMKCGKCGSGITADEKFKELKDGSRNRHVYYACTKGKDKECKNKYTNEVILIQEFERIIEKLDFNKYIVKEKISEEVNRQKKFQQMLLGKKVDFKIKEIDIRNYFKFVLREGKLDEKKELLQSIKGEFRLSDNVLSLV